MVIFLVSEPNFDIFGKKSLVNELSEPKHFKLFHRIFAIFSGFEQNPDFLVSVAVNNLVNFPLSSVN